MLNRTLVACLTLTASASLAQARTVETVVPRASLKLACPAGTLQTGGAHDEAVLCARVTAGQRVFHGPYLAFWPNGVRQSEGQYDEGFRSGRWVFYDQAGLPTGETWFKAGSYDGQRVELYPNGKKRLEEQWVAGKRQGPQRSWDATGTLTVIEYRDDRPLER